MTLSAPSGKTSHLFSDIYCLLSIFPEAKHLIDQIWFQTWKQQEKWQLSARPNYHLYYTLWKHVSVFAQFSCCFPEGGTRRSLIRGSVVRSLVPPGCSISAWIREWMGECVKYCKSLWVVNKMRKGLYAVSAVHLPFTTATNHGVDTDAGNNPLPQHRSSTKREEMWKHGSARGRPERNAPSISKMWDSCHRQLICNRLRFGISLVFSKAARVMARQQAS